MDQQPGWQQPGGAPPQYSPDGSGGGTVSGGCQRHRRQGVPVLVWVALGGLVLLMGVWTVALAVSGSHTANPNVSSQDIVRNQATPIPDTPTEVVAVPPATSDAGGQPSRSGSRPRPRNLPGGSQADRPSSAPPVRLE